MNEATQGVGRLPRWGRIVGGGLAGAVMLGGVQVTTGATQAQAVWLKGNCEFGQQMIAHLYSEAQRLIAEGKEEEGLIKLSRIPGWQADTEKCLQSEKEEAEKRETNPWPQPNPADAGSTGIPVSPAPASPASESAPAAPPNHHVALDISNLSELFPDPYDYDTHVDPVPGFTDYGKYYDLLDEAQRRADAGKPLAAQTQTYWDRLEREVKLPNDGVDDAAARALAKEATQGTIQRHPDLTSAIVATKATIAMYELDKERYSWWANSAGLVTAQYLLDELHVEYVKRQTTAQGPTVAYKAKGTTVDPTYTASNDGGTLDIAMKAKARAGSNVKIQVMEYNAEKGRMVIVDTIQAKVSKGGKIHTAVKADAGDVIMVKKNTGKKLAQIEIPAQ